jgi:hypothetical protein
MHFHIPQRRPGAYADIIAVDGDPYRSIKALENGQLVMKDGKVFKSEIKELANCAGGQASVPGPGTGVRFFLQSVLDFGCAVGIMRQSRSLVGTGVGS